MSLRNPHHVEPSGALHAFTTGDLVPIHHTDSAERVSWLIDVWISGYLHVAVKVHD